METFVFVRSWEGWQSPCLAGIAALTTMLTACGSDSPEGNQAARYRGNELRPLGSNPQTLTGAGFRDRTWVYR